MSSFARADWVVVELEARKHDDARFRSDVAARMRTALFELSPKAHWTDRMKRAAGALKSFSVQLDPSGSFNVGLSVDAIEGVDDHGDVSLDLTDLLVAVGEAAHAQGKGVVILLDEIQFLNRSQLEAVIAAIHTTVQGELPVTMVGAGLPQIAKLAGDAKPYAERLFTFPRINNLDPKDAKRALTKPAAGEGVTYSDEALDLAVSITGGYSYFLQELGYALWPLAEGNSIELADLEHASPIYESKLDSFFRVRLDRATELQRAYLRAMAGLGSFKLRAMPTLQIPPIRDRKRHVNDNENED